MADGLARDAKQARQRTASGRRILPEGTSAGGAGRRTSDDGRTRQGAHGPVRAPFRDPYCFSNTSVSSPVAPLSCIPVLCTLSDLPSAETTRWTWPTTLPSFLRSKSQVFASIFLPRVVSAGPAVACFSSLPSRYCTRFVFSLPSVPVSF